MKSFGNEGSRRLARRVPLSHPSSASEPHGDRWSTTVGNERLTAFAGAVLLVLILLELVSSANLHAGITLHIIIGVLLCGPLLVKLGSTSYRFLRYYTGAPAYRRKGPPRLPLRVLAVPLVVVTLAVTGSGIGLVVTGPTHAGPLLPLHDLSVLVWLSLIAIHVGTYLWRTPRVIADEWIKRARGPVTNARWLRLGVNLSALLCGVVATILLFPGVAPWVVWSQMSQRLSSPLVVGLFIATIILLASRPWRWR